MLPRERIPTHPGEVLREEFLQPMNISPARLAEHIGVPRSHVSAIVGERRAITPDMAWLLAEALGTSPEFWIGLQNAYDLAVSRPARTVGPILAAE